ncbi:hypothetical protein [Bartonella refiksaydamii]|uniref:hypothetical protein n=1 Tax=Bartonella refiksaydamii TaxID=2654951 RepID=UPI0012EC1F84|nr:hypothetical protein [Bartonella refiksaydamii]
MGKTGLMSVASAILICVELIRMMNPAFFIAEGSGGGRWFFIVIFILGARKMCPTIEKIK